MSLRKLWVVLGIAMNSMSMMLGCFLVLFGADHKNRNCTFTGLLIVLLGTLVNYLIVLSETSRTAQPRQR